MWSRMLRKWVQDTIKRGRHALFQKDKREMATGGCRRDGDARREGQ